MTERFDDKQATSQILELLQNEIGLSVHSVGSGVVLRAVRARMAQCGRADMSGYMKLLQADQDELARLIDTVVIPETSFFRDNAPFKALEDFVSNQWLVTNPSEPLRILSLPCSTGEEPYSIAMVLSDCNLDSSQFLIDAIDISERLLSIGKTGIYTDYSFRGTPSLYRTRYFRQEGEAYHLLDEIRQSVRFIQGNILDTEFVRNRRPYHIIFCRNLLIYFDIPTKRKALDQLDSILLPNGLIFVGHAETAHVPASGYKRLDFPMAFGFCKQDSADDHSAPALTIPSQPVFSTASLEKMLHSIASQSEANRSSAPQPRQSDRPTEVTSESLPLVTPHQDAVSMVSVSDIELDPNELFALAQALLEAGDDLQAEEALRRVIYLLPTHYNALLLLADLAEKRFDITSADSYRRRAHRVIKRTVPVSEPKYN